MIFFYEFFFFVAQIKRKYLNKLWKFGENKWAQIHLQMLPVPIGDCLAKSKEIEILFFFPSCTETILLQKFSVEFKWKQHYMYFKPYQII